MGHMPSLKEIHRYDLDIFNQCHVASVRHALKNCAYFITMLRILALYNTCVIEREGNIFLC